MAKKRTRIRKKKQKEKLTDIISKNKIYYKNTKKNE